MTRKHFEQIAQKISGLDWSKDTTRDEVIQWAVDFCGEQNPRFNEARFRAACNANYDARSQA